MIITLTWQAPLPSSDVFVQYNVSKNEGTPVNTTQTTWTDTNGILNDKYCVVAEYTDGKSVPVCVVVQNP